MKAKDFITELKKMLGWGYVLGGQGETYTPELAKKWGDARQGGQTPDYFTVRCAHWYGHRVVDCSGLIIEALRSGNPGYPDHTADGLRKVCKMYGNIGSIPERPGVIVHKPGHIGVYLGEGKVIEAQGVAYGVVVTNLKDRPWTSWGELPMVDYTTEAQAPANSPTFHIARLLRKGMKEPLEKDEIKAIQRNLGALGYYKGKVDGDFGTLTHKAVQAFQEDYKLKIDGIVGKQTTSALGGVWDGK